MARFPHALTIDLPDRNALEVTAESSLRGRAVRIRPVAGIHPRFFESCPICGDDATHAEHVPPESMGGRVMTRTCGPCNNGLGSKVEADLVDWHDGALTFPRFSADGVLGARRSKRILYRLTREGAFVLIVDGNIDPAVRDMLEGGQIDLRALLPNINRARLALLKHAFLSACLQVGLLKSAEADAVRAELIAARDSGARREVPPSSLAIGLTVLRSHDGPLLDWPVVHAFAEMDGRRTDGVVLGGTTFVSWSSDPTQEAPEQLPFALSLEVGARLEGVIVRRAL